MILRLRRVRLSERVAWSFGARILGVWLTIGRDIRHWVLLSRLFEVRWLSCNWCFCLSLVNLLVRMEVLYSGELDLNDGVGGYNSIISLVWSEKLNLNVESMLLYGVSAIFLYDCGSMVSNLDFLRIERGFTFTFVLNLFKSDLESDSMLSSGACSRVLLKMPKTSILFRQSSLFSGLCCNSFSDSTESVIYGSSLNWTSFWEDFDFFILTP